MPMILSGTPLKQGSVGSLLYSACTKPEIHLPQRITLPHSFLPRLKKSDLNSIRSIPFHHSSFKIHHSTVIRFSFGFSETIIPHPQSKILNPQFSYSFTIRFFRVTITELRIRNPQSEFFNPQSRILNQKSSIPMPCYNFRVCKQMHNI